jgi:hypothetical protein
MDTAARSRFLQIDFGDPAAENEARTELLDAGYIDPARVFDAIFLRRRFLVLGRKGCGKSALARHLALRSSQHNERFVTSLTAGELLGMLSDNVPASASAQALQWCFLLQLFASLARDQALTPWSAELSEAYRLLEAKHLLPPDTLSRLIRGRTVKLTDPLLKMVQVSFDRLGDDVRLGPLGAQLATRLLDVIRSTRFDNWHVLLIDGFEDEFERLEDMRRVAELVRVARQLNRFFSDGGVPVSVVVLMRPDIYDALDELKDKTKLTLSSGIRLEWFSERGWEADTNLGRLIDTRAELSLGQPVSVANEFLSWSYKGRPVHRILAAYTRATPRDVVVLLRALQVAVDRRGPTARAVLDALEEYAIDYLRDEIRDEVELHVDRGAADQAWMALRRVRGDIRLDALLGSCPEVLDPLVLLRVLYDCGALGQRIDQREAFRYSSPRYEPDWEHKMFVPHPAVAHVLRYLG